VGGQNKSLPNIFSNRVTEKQDVGQIVEYLKAEMVRHCAYKKTKKGGEEEEPVRKAIEKFEASGESIVTEENIVTVEKGKSLV